MQRLTLVGSRAMGQGSLAPGDPPELRLGSGSVPGVSSSIENAFWRLMVSSSWSTWGRRTRPRGGDAMGPGCSVSTVLQLWLTHRAGPASLWGGSLGGTCVLTQQGLVGLQGTGLCSVRGPGGAACPSAA